MQKKPLCILMMLTAIVLFISACGGIHKEIKPENKLTVSDAYGVTMNYSQSLHELIEAGNYFWHDKFFDGIHYPNKKKVKVNKILFLVSLNEPATTHKIFTELDNYNLRAATLRELLTFGATYPEVQKQFPVIALNSGWSSNHMHSCAPYLYRFYYYNSDGERIRPDECERYLGRITTGPDEWAGHQWRFLAAPK